MSRAPYKYIQIEKRGDREIVYFRRGRAARIRLPSLDDKYFVDAYHKAFCNEPVPHVRDIPPPVVEQVKQRVEQTLRSAVSAARCRAAKKSLPFDLTVDWALDQVQRQNFRCGLTGIPFFHGDRTKRRHPYAPSLDRIVPANGYTTANVRIVLFAINAMFNDWGHEIFEQVANSYRYTRRNGNIYSRTLIPAPAPSKKIETNQDDTDEK